MKCLPVVLSALCFVIGTVAHADSQELMVNAQEINGPVAPLKAKVDEAGDLVGLYVYAPDPSIKPDFYPVATFRKGADIGVCDDKGKVHYGVFYIKAPNFDVHNGGMVTIKYNENVIANWVHISRWGTVNVWAGRDESGAWHLFHDQGMSQMVNTLLIKVGTFGIDSVQPE